MAGSIRFLFDFVSPYSYLAWKRIHALAERHQASVEAVPVVLGAILHARGVRPAVEIPVRRAYLIRDLVRQAHLYGIPLVPPPVHPFNPLLALRVASLPMGDEARRRLIDALFDAAWGRGEALTDRAVVARVAAEQGLGDDALVAAESAETKARLRAATDEAVAAGVFGAPTMIAGGELFFGNDGMAHLERFLDGEDPVTPEIVARFGVWA